MADPVDPARPPSQTAADRPGGQASGASPAGPPRSGGTSWLVPALTLLLGLVLGAAGMWLAGRGADDAPGVAASEETTAPTTPVTPTTTAASPGVTVYVPPSCLQIADESRALGDVVGRGLTAARDLDAATLSGIVREFGDLQGTIDGLARDCRSQGQLPQIPTTTP